MTTETTPDLGAEIAAAKGLPDEAADLVTGSTREEMEANADRLVALIAPPPAPTGSADGGPRGTTAPSLGQLGRADLQRMSPAEIVAARKAGRLDDLQEGRAGFR